MIRTPADPGTREALPSTLTPRRGLPRGEARMSFHRERSMFPESSAMIRFPAGWILKLS